MLKHVNRYESNWNSSYDMYELVYLSGKVRRVCGYSNLPKTAKRFISSAPSFKFMRDKDGRFFHRFS